MKKWWLVFGLTIAIGFSLYLTQQKTEPTIGSQPFVMDANLEEPGPVFRLTSDKERIDVSEKQLADETPILETTELNRDTLDQWTQVGGGQQPYHLNDPAVITGSTHNKIIKIIDPRITTIKLESNGKTTELPITSGKNRRFTAYYYPMEKNQEKHNVFAYDNNGNVLWQAFPDSYWN